MVRKWVLKYQRGGYGPLTEAAPKLLPVVVKPRVTRRSTTTAASMSVIEVELRRGVLRLHGRCDQTLLRALIDALSA
jgi:hypothetical protein